MIRSRLRVIHGEGLGPAPDPSRGRWLHLVQADQTASEELVQASLNEHSDHLYECDVDSLLAELHTRAGSLDEPLTQHLLGALACELAEQVTVGMADETRKFLQYTSLKPAESSCIVQTLSGELHLWADGSSYGTWAYAPPRILVACGERINTAGLRRPARGAWHDLAVARCPRCVAIDDRFEEACQRPDSDPLGEGDDAMTFYVTLTEQIGRVLARCISAGPLDAAGAIALARRCYEPCLLAICARLAVSSGDTLLQRLVDYETLTAELGPLNGLLGAADWARLLAPAMPGPELSPAGDGGISFGDTVAEQLRTVARLRH